MSHPIPVDPRWAAHARSSSANNKTPPERKAGSRIAGLVSLLIALALTNVAMADAVSATGATQPRAATVLNLLNWKFIQDDTLTDEAALASDASSWSTVHLPHTWNTIDA